MDGKGLHPQRMIKKEEEEEEEDGDEGESGTKKAAQPRDAAGRRES
jgi:hypothetical protein